MTTLYCQVNKLKQTPMNNILDFVKSLPVYQPNPIDSNLIYVFRGHKCMIMDSSDTHVTFRCIDPKADIGAGVGQDFTVTN